MKRSVKDAPILVFVVLVAACGGGTAAGELRFENRHPVTRVNDRRDVPEKPQAPVYVQALYHFDGHVHKRLTRLLEVREGTRARNVNAMGEVPDSTWFQNRIGVRDLTLEEVRRGPNRRGSPEDHLPWTIISSKVGGAAVGFIIEDARGDRFLLKFDQKGYPEVETGTDVIVQRILWACGYNVPEDYVVYFTRDDLRIAEDAVVKDVFGHEEPLTGKFLERKLRKVIVGPDGSIRGLASRFIDGVPIGGYAGEGVREDDPNDLVPHQHRRDVRGQYAFFSWLDHTDIKQDNTLDAWQEDPADPDHHYVVHYLIDFGKALGTQGFIAGDRAAGHANGYDFGEILLSLVSGGLWVRPWEDRAHPGILGVGLYDVESFDPGAWEARTPSYYPILVADRFDNFWASKILIRFTREQLRAIVEQARFTDPRAERYLVRMLRARQRKVARYWFDRVNPLDGFELEQRGDAYALCFDDLTLKHDLQDSLLDETSYSAVAYDWSGEQTGWRAGARGTLDGRACVAGFRPGPERDGYVIVKLDTYRDGFDAPGTLVHMAKDPDSGELRVIGVRRL